MTTNSYPAVGTGGLTESQWSAMYAGDDGIVEDYTATGQSLALTRSGDVCTISPGMVRINGYTLEVTAAHDLPAPAVSSGTKTYQIAAQYDPALNVADGSGGRTALGPCRLIITDAALDTSGGKQYVLLYTVVRSASQALTAAVVTDYRRWVGPVFVIPDFSSQPTGFGPFPRGSVMVEMARNGVYSATEITVRMPNADGTAMTWQSVFKPLAVAFPLAGGGQLVSVNSGNPAQMLRGAGDRVDLRGSVKRSSGNLGTGAVVVLGTLPAGWRPEQNQRYLVFANGAAGLAGSVQVAPDGTVSLQPGADQSSITYIHLDGISFRAEI